MEFSEEELEEVLAIFQEESEEQIQKLNDNMLRLEQNPQDEKAIQEIFREAHSLKGAARMIGLDDIQTIAHKLEDIFGLARKGELIIKAEVIDIMCNSVDALASIIEDTVKTKGSHSIDVESIVNQLKMIESGQIYNLMSGAVEEEKPKKRSDKKQIPKLNLDDIPDIDDLDEPLSSLGSKKKEDTPVLKQKAKLQFEDLQLEDLEEEPRQILPELPDSVAKHMPPGLEAKLKKTSEEKSLVVDSPKEESKEINIEQIAEQEGFSDDELSELKQIFYAESIQTIDFIFESMEKLKHSPYDREIISEVYRHAHSLEGSTRIINFEEIKDLTYSVRDIFEQATKEEIFINSEILYDLEKQLAHVKEIIQKAQYKEGFSGDMDLDQLQEQIDQKMEVYKKQNIKPKKVKTQKVSLSSDALNFDEEEVLKEFGVIKEQEIQDIKPKEPQKKLEVDPLTLSDEELGDLEIGSLKGFMPTDMPEHPPKEKKKDSLVTSGWSISSKVTPTPKIDNDFEDNLEDLLQKLIDDLNLLSHNVSNKGILEKLNQNILRVKNLTIKENHHVLLAIITKVETIFFEAASGKTSFTTEMAIVMAQSLDSAKALVDMNADAVDIVEDPSLIYQRLMILHQTARLTAGIPFEEEEEPEIFQNMKYGSKETEETSYEKPAKEPKGYIETQVEKIKTTPIKKDSPTIMAQPKSMFAPKSGMAPVGEMSPDDDKARDTMETYTIKTLRVDTRKLDQLVAQVGELIIAKIKAKERLNEIENLLNFVEEWQRDWAKTKYAIKATDKKQLKAAFMAEGTSIYTPGKDMHDIIRQNSDRIANFTNQLNMLYRNIQEDDTRLTLIIGELEDKIKNVRLLPLATIFNMYPRMVRDFSRQNNKDIELEIRGSETTVDKKIIEEIKSPLMHILRNAMDHGIEEAERRLKSGKSSIGKIVLAASHLENSVLIEIIDDGRGIDIESIKSKVLEKELLTPSELAVMTENQIMNIIFWPGFSTSKEVTDISGRGVGMDVVHTKITQLNGKVKVHSDLGKGCKVSIQLPVTMATIQVFLVRIQNQTYAIPASAIKTAVLVKPEDIFYKEGRQTVLVGGIPVFLSDLAELLEIRSDQHVKEEEKDIKKEKITVLVMQSEDNNIGFIVDGLLGDQEILHKNLEPPLIRVRNVAGVTTLGSGEVCLILNVGDLTKTAQMNYGMALRSAYKKKSQTDSQKKDILVVDDSVTTRILERNILRAAGYNVTVAVNGLDALTKLATQSFDLIVSDVEMPDITGYELTSRIKKDDMLSNIPVVLVTSLASEVDRQKGMSSGASAYITKGGFNQEELLGTIRRLLS
ncbi:MAG: Hpt domain-containing protein [Cyanobacteriota bacterium]